MKKRSMRIACVYLPSLPVQVHVRRAAHLAGQAFAVADESERPTVVACSRAAWEQGVRPSMRVTKARHLCPDLIVRNHDAAANTSALEALVESLLALSNPVDIGVNPEAAPPASGEAPTPQVRANHSVYLRLPPGTRGAAFGDKVLALVSRQGFRGRVGIADDRFTAWVAAIQVPEGAKRSNDEDAASLFAQACVVVPRGGSAAFLADQPLRLLPLDRDVLRMMHALGIKTLGDFGALPPPTLSRRWSPAGTDYQALARGEDATPLRPFVPQASIADGIELEKSLTESEPLGFLLRPLFDRVCARLRGRDRAASRLALVLRGDEPPDHMLVLAPTRPTISSRTMLDLARAKLAEERIERSFRTVEVVVLHEAEPEPEELALFDGEGRGGGEFRLEPFSPTSRGAHRRTRRGSRGKRRPRHKKSSDSPPRQGLFDR